ncbi:MAG: S-adenosyl-l-methionine hydroxide adenosyltransferase family protein [Alphaproteobacteria bacterium]
MIILFTDFGPSGPYVGQMRSAIAERAPNEIIIELLSNAPAFEPRASAYLLAALARDFPDGSLFLCIIDPGVGGSRLPLIIRAGNQIFVGPDNGLFSIIIQRSSEITAEKITWRPDNLSASFHGRDLFAPVAAMIATGMKVETIPIANHSLVGTDWPEDLYAIIYVDHFGNAITGIRAKLLSQTGIIECSGKKFSYAKTFSSVETGAAFWYENANGLIEIAVNQGRADGLGLVVGQSISVSMP